MIAKAICAENSYRFIERVGEGAFKVTYHVKNLEGVSEALKIYREGYSNDRTLRELKAMLRCNHPNICKLLQVSKFQYNQTEILFTLEEFLPGGTLTRILEREGCLNFKQVKLLANALIDAVEHISSHNLVHRDIKPDNILFKDKKTPVIVDFGLVRDLSDVSLTHTWVNQGPGSPFFSAPEQLNNEKELIDWRTDQFAIGILLSLCAFGIHPYQKENDTPSNVVERVSRREQFGRKFINEAKGLLPLSKMVSQWPIKRYRTTSQLKEAWYNLEGSEK